jgi:hypothetical protein
MERWVKAFAAVPWVWWPERSLRPLFDRRARTSIGPSTQAAAGGRRDTW